MTEETMPVAGPNGYSLRENPAAGVVVIEADYADAFGFAVPVEDFDAFVRYWNLRHPVNNASPEMFVLLKAIQGVLDAGRFEAFKAHDFAEDVRRTLAHAEGTDR